MTVAANTEGGEKRGLAKRWLTPVAFVAFMLVWAVAIAFIKIQNDYVAFALLAAAGATLWAIRRWQPQRLTDVIEAGQANPRLIWGTSAVVLLSLPLLFSGSAYWIHVFTLTLIYGIALQGLNIHLGEIGAIDVGYAGFFAIGAYCSAILIVDHGASFWATLFWSTLACWVAGLALGCCTIRTTGDYLALVTLGFGLVVYQLIVNMSWLTHGTDGLHLPKPAFMGHSFAEPLDLGFVVLPSEANFYYLSLVCLTAAALLAKAASESWIGRTWAAMRQDRVGAGCFGVNVPLLQVFSFAFGTAFAGVAGALYASEIGFIVPHEFTIFFSMTVICMVIMGGMGNWWGVVVGAFIMVVIPEKLREFQELRYFLYGLVLLLILIRRPFGLFPSARRRYERVLG